MELDLAKLQKPYSKVVALWLEARGPVRTQEEFRDLIGCSKAAMTAAIKELREAGAIENRVIELSGKYRK